MKVEDIIKSAISNAKNDPNAKPVHHRFADSVFPHLASFVDNEIGVLQRDPGAVLADLTALFGVFVGTIAEVGLGKVSASDAMRFGEAHGRLYANSVGATLKGPETL